MPCENTGHLTALDAFYHFVEDETTGFFRGLALYKLVDDFQMLTHGELMKLGDLRLDAQNLAIRFVGTLAGIKEKFGYDFIGYLINGEISF